MYSAVLMLAVTTGTDAIDHGRRGCHGCSGYAYSGCHGYVGGYGCHGYSSGCCGSGGYYRSGYYGYGSMPMYYSNGTYYSTGPYFYSSPMVQNTFPESRQSFYFDPNQQQQGARAMVRVLLPTGDAEVWFDNNPTQQRGTERMFVSPSIQAGSNYEYTVKARWNDNGQTVNQERHVRIQPGQPVTVDFRTGGNPGERLQNPKGTEPRPDEKKQRQ